MLRHYFKKVLICSDFSANSDFAFDYALEICQRSESTSLYLLHVIPEVDAQFWKTYIYEVEDDIDAKAKSDIDKRLEPYKQAVPAGQEFHIEIRIGKDHREILDYAREISADLIVLGRQSKNSFQKAFMGDITEKICRSADCAVLVMPASYQQRLDGKG